MKKTLSLLFISGALTAISALLATACTPYDLTDSLGGKTLVYSSGPSSSESYVFNAKGDGGDYDFRYYTYGYPAAADEGDYARKAWFQTSGSRGTFSYDKANFEIVFTRSHVYEKIPSAATSYQADYKEYAILEYWKEYDPECTQAVVVTTNHLLFNQDGVMRVFFRDADGWLYSNSFRNDRSFGADTENDSYEYTERYAISGESIAYSSLQNLTWVSNGAVARTFHYASDESHDVVAVYEVGASDASAQFADIWKKGNVASFRTNRRNYSWREWDGDTPPSAPTVDPLTGYGTAGTSGTRPLNYHYINGNLSATTLSFKHYGDFMTFWTNAASRGIDAGTPAYGSADRMDRAR